MSGVRQRSSHSAAVSQRAPISRDTSLCWHPANNTPTIAMIAFRMAANLPRRRTVSHFGQESV